MKKENMKNKKVTIDDLAVMIAEGREETSELARMVAKGFESVDTKFIEVRREIAEAKRDIIEVKDNLASTRGDILAMGDQLIRGSATDRFAPSCLRPRREFANSEFYDLATRVGILEQKTKVKTKNR